MTVCQSAFEPPPDAVAGSGHVAALTEDGRVFALGDNEYGQCGQHTTAKVKGLAGGKDALTLEKSKLDVRNLHLTWR